MFTTEIPEELHGRNLDAEVINNFIQNMGTAPFAISISKNASKKHSGLFKDPLTSATLLLCGMTSYSYSLKENIFKLNSFACQRYHNSPTLHLNQYVLITP